ARTAALRGAAIGSGEGARPGLIRGNFTASTGAAVTPPGRGPFPGRGGATSAMGRQGVIVPGKNVQIVTNHNTVEMSGILRHDGETGLYYLSPDQGGAEFLVFPQQMPVPPVRAWGPGAARRMRVTWKEGVVQKIEPAGPLGPAGSF